MIWMKPVGRMASICAIAGMLSLAACRSTEPAVTAEDANAGREAALAREAAMNQMISAHGGSSLRDGVFSQAQVDAGKKIFFDVCIECHQPEAFTGPGFMDAWAGQTVDVIFEKIRTTMPEDAPGRLSRREYTAVLAFFFNLNGLPTGEADMPNRSEQLKEIIIATAKG